MAEQKTKTQNLVFARRDRARGREFEPGETAEGLDAGEVEARLRRGVLVTPATWERVKPREPTPETAPEGEANGDRDEITDYEQMNVDDLRVLAKDLHLDVPAKAKKAELVEAVTAAMTFESEEEVDRRNANAEADGDEEHTED